MGRNPAEPRNEPFIIERVISLKFRLVVADRVGMEINSNDRLANATTLLRIASIMIANDDIGAAIVALRDASVALAIEQDVRNEATVKRHMEKQ